MDAEQIRGEMKATRASIDRKLDALSDRTSAAKQRALTLASVAALVAAAKGIIVWWSRRAERHARRHMAERYRSSPVF